MHRLLDKQIQEAAEGDGGLNLQRLLDAVDSTYKRSDEERRGIVRSMQLMSDEAAALTRELKESTASQLQAILDHVKDVIITVDELGHVASVNTPQLSSASSITQMPVGPTSTGSHGPPPPPTTVVLGNHPQVSYAPPAALHSASVVASVQASGSPVVPDSELDPDSDALLVALDSPCVSEPDPSLEDSGPDADDSEPPPPSPQPATTRPSHMPIQRCMSEA